uniref:NADH dehydrogenase subunit 3 n=1 Tax=Pirkimerus japonicus TaxID=2869168 RepID=UPI002176ED69|nr:NADH dehydrogenase subunit 3 [Pirkimerus japonicus]UUJ37835.1 NADH dehydrogenase subunit 3 [Pirkimerus japonicus]
MYKMLLSMLMVLMITMTLMLTLSLISKNSIIDREKMSPYECGFDSKSKARMPFSTQFFLIAVLFLIFDIEVAIILPMMLTMKTSNMIMWMMTVFMFILILIMGLYHEWSNNMLEWK